MKLDQRKHIAISTARPTPRYGFTLVEVMVAMAVLTMIMLLTLSATDGVAKISKRTRARIDTFQEARAGFELMTRRLSQSMLNTYWDYEYPNNNRSLTPTAYVRQSELHFVSGAAKGGSSPLLPATALQSATHGVFFQSPQGFSSPMPGSGVTVSANLQNLLNVSGYFLEYTSDKDDRPVFLRSGAGVPPERWRMRLTELNQASEYFRVYLTTNGRSTLNPFDWFRLPLGRPAPITEPQGSRVLAENIVALVLLPHRSPNDPIPTGAPRLLAPNYFYDSRGYVTRATDKVAQLTRNQLPPMVQVTMAAIDEESAARLEDSLTDRKTVSGLITALLKNQEGSKNLFDSPARTASPATAQQETEQYVADLKTLEENLTRLKLTYRIFSTDVSILQAKWSEN